MDARGEYYAEIEIRRLKATVKGLYRALERLKIEVVLSDVDPAYIEQHFRPHLDKAEAALAEADDRPIKPTPRA